MDIDLLSKMVKELVMDHDAVTLPGVGTFVAELVPASFADRGYTILPPYRRLYFSPRQGTDTLLLDFYQTSNPEVSRADASRILSDFLREMKEVLMVKKTIVFPGLGRLRATRENHFFFVADEDLDIYPAAFGLQPISLKTHEETPEEVAAAVSNLAAIMESDPEVVISLAPEVEPEPESVIPGPDRESVEEEMAGQAGHDEEPVPEPVPEPEPEPQPVIPGPDRESVEEEMAGQAGHDEEPVPEPVPEPEPVPAPIVPEKEQRQRTGWPWWAWTLLVLGIVLLLALVGLMVVGRVAPEWLDRYLYSAEELKILHP